MTNELNRVHQAEARERDNDIHVYIRVTKTECVGAGVE